MRLPRSLRLACALAAGLLTVPLGVSAASADQPAAPATWTVQVGEESPNQAIQGMAFLPKDIYIHPGDTIKWVAKSAEIHTVTFLATGGSLASLQPFNPANPQMLLRQGGPTYDGHSYYNSGVLTNVSNSGFPASDSYSLAFPVTLSAPSDFTYYCLVHGEMMKGTVHLLPASTPYPFSQKDYDKQARATVRAILLDGRALWRQTRRSVNEHTVAMGADDGTAMVMRFVQPTVVIHVGQSVTFQNNGMAAPHTVTFGVEPTNIFAPFGDPTHFTGGDLSSGVVLPIPGMNQFTVTFKKAGTFHYYCALHDYMGMVGKVIVVGGHQPRHRTGAERPDRDGAAG